ncbi:MAG TPA: FHA domain-containing protein [Chloroflexi bacterium]|nr:FHA domain-containing protein [Chloroflexota bacterium]
MTYVSRLVMTRGPQLGQTFSLDHELHNLGREPINDIVISDPQISRQHARITRRGRSFVIEDMGSTNGTFVNGMRLTSPHTLAPGDIIGLGDAVTLTYYGPDIATTEPLGPKATVAMEQASYEPPPPRPAPAFVPPPAPTYASPPPPPSYTPPAKEKKGRRWIWMGCGCLVLLVILACGAVFALDYFGLLPDLFYQPFFWLGLDKYLF